MGAGLCVPQESSAAQPVQPSQLQRKVPLPQQYQQPQQPSKALPPRPDFPATPGVRTPGAQNGAGAARSPAPQQARTPGTPGDGPQRCESPQRRERERGRTPGTTVSATRDLAEPRPPMRWQKGELIGVGAFGRVYVGLDEDTGELLAVKEVRVFAARQRLSCVALLTVLLDHAALHAL